jgi:hypothetical protein
MWSAVAPLRSTMRRRKPEDYNTTAWRSTRAGHAGWTFTQYGGRWRSRCRATLDCNDGELLFNWVRRLESAFDLGNRAAGSNTEQLVLDDSPAI